MSESSVKFFSLHQYHAKSGSVPADATKERRVILTWKTTGDKHAHPGIKIESRFIDVPTFKVHVTPETLTLAMQAAYEGFEDGLIRSLVEAKFNWATKAHGKLSISSDELCVAKVAEFAAASGLGRLSAEAIGAWFDSIALLPIAEEVARKRGIPGQTTADGVIEATSKLRAAITACASTKLAMPVKTAEALIRAFNAVSESLDDPDSDHMLAKLFAVVTPFSKPDEIVGDLI